MKTRFYGIVALGIALLLATTVTAFNDDTLNITVIEQVEEVVAFNGTIERMWDESIGIAWSGESLQQLNITGNITIENPSGEVISDINITFNGTSQLLAIPIVSSEPSYTATDVSGSPGSNIYVYIRELHSGDRVVLFYDLDDSGIGEPLNITETYSKMKLLVNRTVDVSMNVTASTHLSDSLTNVVITKVAQGYPGENGGVRNFTFTELSNNDSNNASINNLTHPHNITWAPMGGTLNPGDSALINFTVRAPIFLNTTFLTDGGNDTWHNETWGRWLNMGNVTLEFQMLAPLSGLTINNVTGIARASVSVGKRRVNETHWRIWPQFNDTSPSIDYNLTEIAIWATEYQDYNPGNDSLTGSRLSWILGINLSSGTGWENTTGTDFEYEQVPVAWVTANFTIWDNGTINRAPETSGQINRLYTSYEVEDGYVFIEDIFVLSGYMVKVSKHVRQNIGTDNQYNVTVVLENVGSTRTPDWVTVYDLVPPNFDMDGDSNDDYSDEGEITVTKSTIQLGITTYPTLTLGAYTGYTPFIVDLSAINGSSNGDTEYDSGGSEVQIEYKLNGTGLYSVENAFLIGVDPIRVEGAMASQIMKAEMGLAPVESAEGMIALVSIVVSLVILLPQIAKGKE